MLKAKTNHSERPQKRKMSDQTSDMSVLGYTTKMSLQITLTKAKLLLDLQERL